MNMGHMHKSPKKIRKIEGDIRAFNIRDFARNTIKFKLEENQN